ncbi:MAG: hypothetical protein QW059_05190 [Nitrososphaerota archaeon]
MDAQQVLRVLEGVAAGVVYGFSGYLKSRAASGAGLRPEGLFSAALWGGLVGLVSGAMGVDMKTAENILFDLGLLVLVKKLSEAVWHSPPIRRIWSR